MPRVEFDVETSVAPERVREALLDFSERRPELWPGLEPSAYEVYEVRETSANVKEGSKLPGKVIWARERYDWPTPDTIRWTVEASNFLTPGSFQEVSLHPRDGGGTRVHVVWQRTGSTLLGKLLVGMIALGKGKPVASSLRQGFAVLEGKG
jgi:hypothetical protein